MKSHAFGSLVTALALGGLLASCAPSPVNTETPNALIARPDNLTLTNSTDTVSTSLALVCGCTFPTGISSYLQDTSVIRYKYDTPLSVHVTPHVIKFYVAPGTPTGTYHSRMAVFAPDDAGETFYDTITVTVNVP